MEINTKAYGLVEIDPEWILHFENGLLGFEDMHKFVMLSNPEGNDILLWLQSLEDENLAFVVIKPETFRPDYHPKIHWQELTDLEVEEQTPTADLAIFAIVVVPEDITQMTANLVAPIIINLKNKKAKQIVLKDDTYKIKEYILAK